MGFSHLELDLKKSVNESGSGIQLNYGIESKISLATSSESENPEQSISMEIVPRKLANNSLGYSQISPYLGIIYKVRSTTIGARFIYSRDTQLQRNTDASLDYRFSYEENHVEANFEVNVIKNLTMGILGSLGNGSSRRNLTTLTVTNDQSESFSKLYANYQIDSFTLAGLNLYSANESIPDPYHSSGVGLSFSRSIE